MLYYSHGSAHLDLSSDDLSAGLRKVFQKIGQVSRVLAIPPDITRYHSRAGELTRMVWDYYGDKLTDILPALGTHKPMTEVEIEKMFGSVPRHLFRVHNWRKDLTTLGIVPASYVNEVSEGAVNYPWPAEVNRLLVEGGHDLIISIGQVVPHEVVGMANHNKNIFIGTGGSEGINKSHFQGAAYGMERIMGRADTPVRRVLNYASDHFAGNLPLLYVLTVVAADEDGRLKTRGLFIGDGYECFEKAAELSLELNFTLIEKPLGKVVVYLDPEEFKSTWLGNKAIYRTRMAVADGGELIILAPGLREFGEDEEIDRLIRKYGYFGTDQVLLLTEKNEDLTRNLSAAAHLIHGSSDGRFEITYCPGRLTRDEIEGAGFKYASIDDMEKKYNPQLLRDGRNTLPDGEEVFFISNPALGLWACKERFF
jgi:nickel-dependent lactate racemase